jgi:hypothetical protein
MKQVFKMAAKIFLLLTGSVMLLGGGICAAMDAFFAIGNGFKSEGMFLLVLMVIACLIAWAGWMAIKLSGIFHSQTSSNEIESAASNETADK